MQDREQTMDRDELEQLTKAELYDLATEQDVDGRSGMTKDELIDALAAPDSVTVPAGGIDPKLVQARDELRTREQAEADAVEPRPVVSGLSDTYVAAREATREQDAASERSVTDQPE